MAADLASSKPEFQYTLSLLKSFPPDQQLEALDQYGKYLESLKQKGEVIRDPNGLLRQFLVRFRSKHRRQQGRSARNQNSYAHGEDSTGNAEATQPPVRSGGNHNEEGETSGTLENAQTPKIEVKNEPVTLPLSSLVVEGAALELLNSLPTPELRFQALEWCDGGVLNVRSNGDEIRDPERFLCITIRKKFLKETAPAKDDNVAETMTRKKSRKIHAEEARRSESDDKMAADDLLLSTKPESELGDGKAMSLLRSFSQGQQLKALQQYGKYRETLGRNGEEIRNPDAHLHRFLVNFRRKESLQEEKKSAKSQESTAEEASISRGERQNEELSKGHNNTQEILQHTAQNGRNNKRQSKRSGPLRNSCMPASDERKIANNEPLRLPVSSLVVEGRALHLLNSLPTPEIRSEALELCDDAVLNVKKGGEEIRNPEQFLCIKLHRFARKIKPIKDDYAAESMSRQPSPDVDTKEVGTTSPQIPTKTEAGHTQRQELTERNIQYALLNEKYESEKVVLEAVKKQLVALNCEKKLLEEKLTLAEKLYCIRTQENVDKEAELTQAQDRLRDLTADFMKVKNELLAERKEKEDALLRANENSENLEKLMGIENVLERERQKQKEMAFEIQALKAELKRAEMLRPSSTSENNVSSKRYAALKQELQQTQEKLDREKKKNAQAKSVSKSASVAREKPTLFDFVGEADTEELIKTEESQETPRFQQLGASSAYMEERKRVDSEVSPVCFNEAIVVGESNERLEAELSFLASAYTDDEIQISSNTVSRRLVLRFDRDSESVNVNLLLTAPEAYPTSSSIVIDASLLNDPGAGVEARKVAMDTLSNLLDVCRWEAQGCLGSEAMLSILQAADQWLENDWVGIQAKRLPTKSPGMTSADGSVEICRLLISTHHISDPDKIQLIKRTASKYNLGGFVKIGYPGYILVEGLEGNCDSFLETLVQSRRKLRESKGGKTDSATFAAAGKDTVRVDDLDAGRALPKKLVEVEQGKAGMDLVEMECKKVGLANFLDR